MALAKKGTRLINVNDVEYRWIVHPDDEPGMAIVVECADNPGQRMITWVEYGNIISPWLVRRAILHALDRGWYPQQKQKRKGQQIVFRLEGIVSREGNWTGVPSEHKAVWQDVFQASQESLHLSAACPVCRVTALCRWYYIGGKPIKTEIKGVTFVLNGDLWEWCSNCHIFQHYSCLVPPWWSCDLDVDTKKLTALPKAIEKAMKARDISFYSNSSKIASF